MECSYNNDLFRITSWTDIMLTKEKQWTVKTLVREAVNSDSPEATKERYPEHTVITIVAYRFQKRYLQLQHHVEHRELIIEITLLVSPPSFSMQHLSLRRVSSKPSLQLSFSGTISTGSSDFTSSLLAVAQSRLVRLSKYSRLPAVVVRASFEAISAISDTSTLGLFLRFW